jgi:hypothetical protein
VRNTTTSAQVGGVYAYGVWLNLAHILHHLANNSEQRCPAAIALPVIITVFIKK